MKRINSIPLYRFAIAALGMSLSAQSAILVSDDFPTDGILNGQTPSVGGAWTTISGTANQFQVVNGRLQLTDTNSEDLNSSFTGITSGVVFYGFDIIVTDPGSYTGTDFEYFSHFDTSAGFQARTDIAAFSASGWRPGIATSAAAAETAWGSDLAYGSDYRLVVGYDFTSGLASLWVDPSAATDSSISSTTSNIGLTVDGFNFRQSSATPDQNISIGRLRVATTFDEVALSASAVPEPSSAAMLAAAAMASCFRRRLR